MDLRKLEKGSKFGYMYYISYNGAAFDTFDEMKDKKSVKGEFIKIMNELGFTWAKGVQQAGRTDTRVSAKENILYVSSNYSKSIEKLIKSFNSRSSKELQIVGYKKTLSDLVLPELVSGRAYCYKYKESKITRSIEEIEALCKELSGTYDVSKFTNYKGKQLKEKIRSVEIRYENKTLYFDGNSFMPQQVRIMSAYILTGSMEPLPGKYLTLESVKLSKELEDMIITRADELVEENLSYAEKVGDTYIFYVDRKKKGEFIGTRGKNIKKLRKKYGNIVVREIKL